MNLMFSIVVPVYNSEKYLRECVDSLVQQTFNNFEIILVNDGSTDRSPLICDEYAKKFDKIKVLHKENGGHISARNSGCDIAQGQYIFFVDSDDWIEKTALSELSAIVDESDIDIVAFGFNEVKDSSCKKRVNLIPEGLYEQESKTYIYNRMICDLESDLLTISFYPSLWSKIIKTDLVKKWQHDVDPRIRVGEDLALIVPCLLDSNKIYLSNITPYNYRMLESSISHRYDKKAFDNLSLLIKSLKESADVIGYNLEESISSYSAMSSWNIIMRICINNSMKDALSIIKNTLSRDVLDEINKVKSTSDAFKTRLIIYLLKNNKWRIIYLIWRIKLRFQ